jgi:hypothetical protein
MQDRADKQRMAGLFPMVTFVEAAFGIDQDVSDVLDVAHFPFALPYLQQRVVGRRFHVGRIEEQHAAVPGAKACCQRPVLAFDVMDDAASRPGQQRRHNEADAFAAAGRREAQDMLRTIVAQIAVLVTTEHDAVGAEQPGGADFLVFRPAGRTIGRDVARFPRADDRHGDGGGDGDEAARCGDDRALGEDLGRIGVEREPPPEEDRGIVDRPPRHLEPGGPELHLKAEPPCCPLRRRPGHHQCDGQNNGDLTP